MIKVNDNCTFISRTTLLENKSLCFEFILDKCFPTLISGVLIDSNGKPISNACIEVYSQHHSLPEKLLGRTFSNLNGEYGFTLKVDNYLTYIFYVYCPL